jgi:UTP--glucose-1-phosphate uridylyltransferase
MIDRFTDLGSSVIAPMQVPRAEIARYGCARISGIGASETLIVTGCVEKPSPSEAPSTFAISGRYVLGLEVAHELEAIEPDARGEIQLTPALDHIARTSGLVGVEVQPRDRRIDIGNWKGWFAANEAILGPGAALSGEYEAPTYSGIGAA